MFPMQNAQTTKKEIEMSKPETMMIDEVKYVRADSVQQMEMSDDIRICILHRGFIYVGNFEQNGVNCVLKNAKNVRRWGTKKGLGELAEKGPQENTILDDCGIVRFHEQGVIAFIDCSAKWK